MTHRQITPRKISGAPAILKQRATALAGCFLLSGLFLSGCQTSSAQNESAAINARNLAQETAPSLSDSLASNYLMARHAVYGNDLPSATDFFTKSLVLDDNNIALLRHSFLTHYQSGNIEQAAEIARRMESLNVTMPLASEPALIEAALANDWEAVAALSDILSQSDTSFVIAGVARSWALFAQGQFAGAVGQMSQIADLLKNDVGLTPVFMELQIAFLLEAAGKRDEALSYLANFRSIDSYPPHIQLSIAAAYHRLGARDTAQKIIKNHLSPSFDKQAIAQSFANGGNHLLRPLSVRRGLGQALLDTSWLDNERSVRSLLLARAHLALIIAPEFDAAHFVVAQEYLALGQKKPAMRHLEAIKADSAYYLPSQLVLISYLRRADRHDDALALARELRGARPDNERLLLVESDILRSIDRCGEAVSLYKALLGGQFDTSRLHRNLAICLERSATNKAQEDEAERYFLSSLERDPNDAYTLNYLGYWYADTNRNLDKAIDYIQRAVKIQPSSGFFVDSLGWVYYRLKDYETAVEWLEQAIQLEPLDPIITEHLGDAYWQVDRQFEAVYKWRLALEQAEDDEMRERITKKLEAAAEEGDPLAYEAFLMPQPVKLTAHAKVNLNLSITGRDAGGYHELISAVCFTSFGDRLMISPAERYEISYDGPFAEDLQQAGGDHLIHQSGLLAGSDRAHHIHLDKQIPLGGGLGGGSADAAAYLRFLSSDFSEKEITDLRARAEALGADVPACFDNKAHIMAGRGAKSYPLSLPDDRPFMVITNPLIHSDTRAVFARYAASSPRFHNITPHQINALITKGAWGEIMGIGNDLTSAACALYPVIDDLLAQMANTGKQIGDDFIGAQMTGSGASCFALLQDEMAARTYCKILTEKGIWAVATDLF